GAAARRAAEKSLKQSRRAAGCGMVQGTIIVEQVLHALPGLGRHDGRLLSLVKRVLVADHTGIGDVGEESAQSGRGELTAAPQLSVPVVPAFAPPGAAVDFPERGRQCSVL